MGPPLADSATKANPEARALAELAVLTSSSRIGYLASILADAGREGRGFIHNPK